MNVVNIYPDDMYPVYFINYNNADELGRQCHWPEELNFEEYTKVREQFKQWQNELENLYKRSPPSKMETQWYTTNSALQIPTSSTPIS